MSVLSFATLKHTPAVSWMKSANIFATLFISLQICIRKQNRVKGNARCDLILSFSCWSHLSLYCHFDSEGDKIGEEPFKPVWSGRSKRKHKIFRQFCHGTDMLLLFASDLLFITLQMKQELVEPQITV